MPNEHITYQTMASYDGRKLGRRLNGYLRDPYVTALTFLTYRYHDFDPETGKKLELGANSIIKRIGALASKGVEVTFVTRDPMTDDNSFSSSESNLWMKGLQYLAENGAKVFIHSSLHAKVYVVERDGDVFFSVGSSNLTKQGMGYRWSECNVVSWSKIQYEDLRKEVARILGDKRNICTLQEWDRRNKKSQGLQSLRFM